MCLTLSEGVFREADQRVRQRVGCLAIEVVKLLVKLLRKLGPILFIHAFTLNILFHVTWCMMYSSNTLDHQFLAKRHHAVRRNGVCVINSWPGTRSVSAVDRGGGRSFYYMNSSISATKH
jgi:hypothetical protein